MCSRKKSLKDTGLSAKSARATKASSGYASSIDLTPRLVSHCILVTRCRQGLVEAGGVERSRFQPNRFRRRRSVTQRAVGSEVIELLPPPFDQYLSLLAGNGPASLRPDSTKTLSGKSEGFTLFVCDFSFGFLGVSEWPQ